MVLCGKRNDSTADFPGKLFVDAGGFADIRDTAFRTILAHTATHFVQQMIHPVFVTGEVDKLPSQDRAIRTHHAAHSVVVDAEVYRKNGLLLQRGLIQRNRFFKSEAQRIPAVSLYKRGSGRLDMRPLLGDIISVLLAQAYRNPDPVVVSIQLQESGSPIDLFVHVIPIKSGHVRNLFWHTRLFAVLPVVFPILMI